MRIAILGAGNVGGGLGTAFVQAGHDVVYGVRDPESTKTLATLGEVAGATATDPGQAVSGADVVVFALRWDAVPPTVRQLPSMTGRVVIDASNRLDGDPGRSSTQDLAQLLPGARVVKAFNTIGYENLATAKDRTMRVAMFVAGDDAEAKQVAMGLASDIGFEPEDAGGLGNAKALEEMVRVWLALTQQHGRRIGFALSKG